MEIKSAIFLLEICIFGLVTESASLEAVETSYPYQTYFRQSNGYALYDPPRYSGYRPIRGYPYNNIYSGYRGYYNRGYHSGLGGIIGIVGGVGGYGGYGGFGGGYGGYGAFGGSNTNIHEGDTFISETQNVYNDNENYNDHSSHVQNEENFYDGSVDVGNSGGEVTNIDSNIGNNDNDSVSDVGDVGGGADFGDIGGEVDGDSF